MSETVSFTDKLFHRSVFSRRVKEIYKEIRSTPDASVDLWLEAATPPVEQSFVQYRSEIFANGLMFAEYFPSFAERGVDPQVLLFDLFDQQQAELSAESGPRAVYGETKNILDEVFGDALRELRQDWQNHYFLPVCEMVDERGEQILAYNTNANIQYSGRLMQINLPNMVGKVIVPEMLVSATPEPLPGEECVVCLRMPDIEHPDPKLVAQHIAAAELARQNLCINPHLSMASRRKTASCDSVAIQSI